MDMAMPPEKLHRVVWVTSPAVLYFALRAYTELTKGAAWNGVGMLAMAASVASVPFVSKGGFLKGWRAVLYVTLASTGIVMWLAGTPEVVRVMGFVLVFAVQVVALAMLRRTPAITQPAVAIDGPAVLDLHK
jgi:hypothetical protein